MSSSESTGWSIRARLASRLTITIGIGLAIVLFVLDDRIDAEVYAQLDKTLGQQTQTVADSLVQDGTLAHISYVYNKPAHRDFFSLYGPRSTLLLSSPNSKGVALALPPAGSELPTYYDLSSPDGQQSRALAINVLQNGEKNVLVVATERTDWDASECRIHRTLLAAIAIATAMVVGISLLIVRGAFEPLMADGALAASLDANQTRELPGHDLPRELAPYAEAIRGAFERLYAAIERERRFSRDIAHELRTPLAEIRATSEVAIRNDEVSELRAGLIMSITATERMQRSVDTLLTLARVESERDALALDPLDLVALVKSQIASLHHTTRARAIAVLVSGQLAAWIHSDLGILERILSNLLQNAIEYSPANSTVQCRIATDVNGFVLTISNEAPLLLAEDLNRFGARFWRKDVEGGTATHAGLGLALCFALARNLDVKLDFKLEGGHLNARLGAFPAL